MDRSQRYYYIPSASKEALFLHFRMQDLQFYHIDGQICYWDIVSSSLVFRCRICVDWSIAHRFFHRIFQLPPSCRLFRTLLAFIIITIKFIQSILKKY